MKKSVKSILSIVLVVLMVCSLSVCVFAEEAEEGTNIQQFENYCSIGDSVAYGVQFSSLPDTFPRLVGRAVGCTDESMYVNECGMRVKDMLVALNVTDIDESDPYYVSSSWGSTIKYMDRLANQGYYENMVKRADLITLQLGLNDVFYDPLTRVNTELLNDENAATSDKIAEINTFVENVYAGLDSLFENYPKLIERIQELKEGQEYTIVVVGYYNATHSITVSDEFPLPIGSAGSAISAIANAKIKEIAEQYGCKFADISNVETGAMEKDIDIFSLLGFDEATSARATHPSYPTGYAYIARQILAQLKVEEAEPDYNIRVDLGGASNISKVAVNGILLDKSKYSYDENSHVLTINNSTPLASTLTVTTNDGKTIGTYTYQLSYKSDTCYTAYLMYYNRDVVKTVTAVGNGMKTAGVALGSAIKGLFSK